MSETSITRVNMKVDTQLYEEFKAALRARDVAGDPPRRNVTQELTAYMIQVVREYRKKEGK